MSVKLKVLKNGIGVIAVVGKGATKRAAVGDYGFDALCNLNQALAQETAELRKEIRELKSKVNLMIDSSLRRRV